MRIYEASTTYDQVGAFGYDLPQSNLNPMFSRERVFSWGTMPPGWPEVRLPPNRIPSLEYGERFDAQALAHFPADVPVHLVNAKRYPRRLHDIWQNLLLSVSEGGWELIEALEPGCHQFIPHRLVDRDSSRVLYDGQQRYFLNILNYVSIRDAYHLDRPHVCVTTDTMTAAPWGPSPIVKIENQRAHLENLELRRAAIENLHLWRIGLFIDYSEHPPRTYVGLGSRLYVTEVFRAAFHKAKLTGLSFREVPVEA